MRMIIGLGNPGASYDNTRHNVGFHVLDKLADELGIRIYINRGGGLTGQGFFEGEKLLLVKPLTFMNLSGECAGPLASYYRLPPENILVICDDVNLPLGQLRIRGGGSAGGHNGLKSLISHLGSQDFPRIRLGVGASRPGEDLAHHVLKPFTPAEEKEVALAEKEAADAALLFLKEGLSAAMNRYNRKRGADGEKL